jgi:3'(2'), 5'-bisphosphate nucleotidase
MTMTLDGQPLTYGKRGRADVDDFVNPTFVAKGRIEE